MKEKEIVISVDKDHRIKVYPEFINNDWRWYVEKQSVIIFGWWGSSSWGNTGLFMKIYSYMWKAEALAEAEKIKKNWLSLKEKATST